MIMRCFMDSPSCARSKPFSLAMLSDLLDTKNIAAISYSASRSLARVCSEHVRSHFQLRKNRLLDLSRKKHGGPLIGELRLLKSRASICARGLNTDGPASHAGGLQAESLRSVHVFPDLDLGEAYPHRDKSKRRHHCCILDRQLACLAVHDCQK